MAVNKTRYMIAEASQGEEGTTGSLSGDQIGVELRTRRWYEYTGSSLGWATVFRVDDPAVAERIAQFMERIVLNGHVGYDQNGRSTLETALARVGYDPSAVHTPCEADCSMTAYEAVKYATGIDCPLFYDEAIDPETGLCVTRDAATGLCGETYFLDRKSYPVGTHFHYYMTRILPLNGVKVSVYTLSGAVNGVQRSDFYPRNDYRCVNRDDNDALVLTASGEHIHFTAPYFKRRYYETPYERKGITPAIIAAAPSDLAQYTQTINGVTYYNEIGRSAALFNAEFDTTTYPASAPQPVDFSATTSGGNTVTLGWEPLAPYDALTAEQIQTLDDNLTISVSNDNETGYLLPASGGSYPANLKRGDLILTRCCYKSDPGTPRTGVLANGETVSVPRYGSAGHIAVWI